MSTDPGRFPPPATPPTPDELLSWLDGAIDDVWLDDDARRVRIRDVDGGSAHLDIVPPEGWPDDVLVRYRIQITAEDGDG